MPLLTIFDSGGIKWNCFVLFVQHADCTSCFTDAIKEGINYYSAMLLHKSAVYQTNSTTSLHITGSAVALHCCKAHAKINRKWEIRPCKIVPPENCILKLCTLYDVRKITLHANFGFNRYTGGSAHIGEMLPLCDLLS